MKKTIAVIFGGRSSEYEVSLMSAAEVIKNIDKEKYDLLTVGITREGDFYLYDGEEANIENDTWFKNGRVRKITFSVNRSDRGIIILDTNKLVKIDLAFPVLHGQNGEDGRLQGLLELAGIPCIGCDMVSSAVCMDKFLAHTLAEANGLSVPKGYLFKKTDRYDYIEKKISELKYPLFVKPLKAGSSVGVARITDSNGLKKALEEAFIYDDKAIIEESAEGFEVGCAILGNVIGEVDEIEINTEKGFFDYYEKYHLKTGKIHLPARLSESERQRIKDFAVKIYEIMGCKGFARVDMFYTPDKKIIFNEVNTIPGFTEHSRFPSMLKAVGVSFEEIMEKAIKESDLDSRQLL